MRASCLAFCIWRGRKRGREEIRDWLGGLAGKRPATASGCGGAGPSAALPLLPDAQRHRLRRGALHPAPRRSQRRSTSFFSNLLVSCPRDSLTKALDGSQDLIGGFDPDEGLRVSVSGVDVLADSMR